MAVKVRFYITVDANFSRRVTDSLKSFDVKVDSYENNPSHLIGTIYVPTNKPLKLVDQMNVYYQIEGIVKISADYDQEHDERVWYRHPVIPMLISAGLTSITIIGILYGLKLTLKFEDYLFIVGIPAIVSFFTGIVHKFF